MTSEHWYEFRAYNEAPQYGWGTSDEADHYADRLNADRAINHFAAYRLSPEMAAALALESRSDTFELPHTTESTQ